MEYDHKNDEYQVVTMDLPQGEVVALFSDLRIRFKLPETLNKYSIRSGDDPDCWFASLEAGVLVNHAADILTLQTVDLGKDRHIELEENSEPNFTDEYLSIDAFIDKYSAK